MSNALPKKWLLLHTNFFFFFFLNGTLSWRNLNSTLSWTNEKASIQRHVPLFYTDSLSVCIGCTLMHSWKRIIYVVYFENIIICVWEVLYVTISCFRIYSMSSTVKLLNVLSYRTVTILERPHLWMLNRFRGALQTLSLVSRIFQTFPIVDPAVMDCCLHNKTHHKCMNRPPMIRFHLWTHVWLYLWGNCKHLTEEINIYVLPYPWLIRLCLLTGILPHVWTCVHPAWIFWHVLIIEVSKISSAIYANYKVDRSCKNVHYIHFSTITCFLYIADSFGVFFTWKVKMLPQ